MTIKNSTIILLSSSRLTCLRVFSYSIHLRGRFSNIFTRHVCISIVELKGGPEKNLKAFLKWDFHDYNEVSASFMVRFPGDPRLHSVKRVHNFGLQTVTNSNHSTKSNIIIFCKQRSVIKLLQRSKIYDDNTCFKRQLRMEINLSNCRNCRMYQFAKKYESNSSVLEVIFPLKNVNIVSRIK